LETRAAQIRQFVNQRNPEALDLLKRIVEIESPTSHPDGVNQVGEELVDRITPLGFEVQRVPSSIYGDHILSEITISGTPRILFYGHMDTVYPVGSSWPFRIQGKRAYGPGVIDMKSGLLTLIFALEALKETGGIPLSVRAFFNSDEEPGSPDSKAHIPDLIKGTDYACVMEPAEPDGIIINRRKGIGRYFLTVRGKAAHSGQQPESGINANREMAHLIIAAENLTDNEVGTTIIAGKFHGGTASHIVSDYAHAEIDARAWDKEELERIEKGMFALEKSNRVIGTKIEVSGGFHRAPMFQLPGAHILQEALAIAGEINHFDIKFGGSGAASDGNNLVAAGVPTIDGLGPVGGRAHSGDEYMEVQSFSERTILLATFLVVMAEKWERGQLSD